MRWSDQVSGAAIISPSSVGSRGFPDGEVSAIVFPAFPNRDRFESVTDPAQLDLFGNRPQLGASPNATSLQSLVPENLSDEALIAALPDAVLADACALAAEVGKRRLSGAVTALVALCNRFVGYGVDCRVPEQADGCRSRSG